MMKCCIKNDVIYDGKQKSVHPSKLMLTAGVSNILPVCLIKTLPCGYKIRTMATGEV